MILKISQSLRSFEMTRLILKLSTSCVDDLTLSKKEVDPNTRNYTLIPTPSFLPAIPREKSKNVNFWLHVKKQNRLSLFYQGDFVALPH